MTYSWAVTAPICIILAQLTRDLLVLGGHFEQTCGCVLAFFKRQEKVPCFCPCPWYTFYKCWAIFCFPPIALIWISFLIKNYLFEDPPFSFMRISFRHHICKANLKVSQLYLETNITGAINPLKGFTRGNIKYQIKANWKYLKNAWASHSPQCWPANECSENKM